MATRTEYQLRRRVGLVPFGSNQWPKQELISTAIRVIYSKTITNVQKKG